MQIQLMIWLMMEKFVGLRKGESVAATPEQQDSFISFLWTRSCHFLHICSATQSYLE